MKRFVKIYTYWLLGILLFTGCDDYLKEDSGDLLIPGKVEEFLPMLYREGFPRNLNWILRTRLMIPGIKILRMLLTWERARNLTSGKER